mmetsp:Transcript_15266/g.18019  ORF Transcript_15266/g.18019 Transcript_15266/m.18019 type:complete len:439 (+) Transcript_15266:253-1569(+)|eukprot:CAMPEP_0204834170 /NCGR_PEP_ID=MMETSP1346-20131115/19012_1 /ASSEMBLY_ACC=CAM_ASM_000771 /TAXON_ID=215587 /ORGANISM="Aplanochytrium stocchinoi, Strain GSBS06" /LENGTH=438 /DNA_ID=CAMNT_0051967277 /DNA_START=179 /DNA_END=1495 /DNA_ORIENTATION=+
MEKSEGYVRSRRYLIKKKPGFNQLTWAQEASCQRGSSKPTKTVWTLEEVREHNNLKKDGWMIIKGKIYEVSKYAPYHPGGYYDLARAVGDDGTDLYEEVHPWVKASAMLRGSEIGTLKNYKGGRSDPTVYLTRRLHDKWITLKLAASTSLTSTTKLFSFEFAETTEDLQQQKDLLIKISNINDNSRLQMPCHCMLRVKKGNNKSIVRPYSPLLVHENTEEKLLPVKGLNPNLLHVAVKLYKNGKISKILRDLNVDDQIQCAFMNSHLSFNNTSLNIDGMRGLRKKQGCFTKLGLIVAGTGILPVIQILQYYFSSPTVLENIEIWLVYSNRSESDILFLEWLNEMAAEFAENFKVLFVLSRPESIEQWSGAVGVFDENVLREYPKCIPPVPDDSEESTRILLCGPPGYEDFGTLDNDSQKSVLTALLRSGYDASYIESL